MTAVKIPRNEESAKEKVKTENRMMRKAIEKRRKYPNKKVVMRIKKIKRRTCLHLKMRKMKMVSQKMVIIGES